MRFPTKTPPKDPMRTPSKEPKGMKNLKFVTVPSIGSEKVGHICEQKKILP